MANNRMYLRCRSCGEAKLIGATFIDGVALYGWQKEGVRFNMDALREKIEPYEIHRSGKLEDELNEFYKEHSLCGIEPKKDAYVDGTLEPKFKKQYPVNVENQFEIAYEIFYDENNNLIGGSEDEEVEL